MINFWNWFFLDFWCGFVQLRISVTIMDHNSYSEEHQRAKGIYSIYTVSRMLLNHLEVTKINNSQSANTRKLSSHKLIFSSKICSRFLIDEMRSNNFIALVQQYYTHYNNLVLYIKSYKLIRTGYGFLKHQIFIIEPLLASRVLICALNWQRV